MTALPAGTGGLTHGQIAEVIANVALNLFTNYFTKASRVDIDRPLVRRDAGRLCGARHVTGVSQGSGRRHL